jgi:hypothetical protein
MNCLVFSSFLFLIPLYVFFNKSNKNNYEYGLSFLIYINFILSILFWMNPIKQSIMHKIDAFFVRVSVICITLYIMFIKNNYCQDKNTCKFIYLLIFCCFIILFYFSHYYSTRKWCCNEHLVCHCFFHIIGVIGVTIAFL